MKHETRDAYSIDDAISAQRALRKAAGLGEEHFPMEAFVGMISDEIDALRKLGKSDSDIAKLIESNSKIKIQASDITRNYARPEQRRPETGR